MIKASPHKSLVSKKVRNLMVLDFTRLQSVKLFRYSSLFSIFPLFASSVLLIFVIPLLTGGHLIEFHLIESVDRKFLII